MSMTGYMKTLTALLGTALAAATLTVGAAPAIAGDTKAKGATTAFTELPTKNYRLSAKFNQRGRLWSSGRHTGLDFSASQGTPVLSVGSGKVVKAGWYGPYGKAVIVRHLDGKQTLYAHLSRIGVKKGRHVHGGQRLGSVGSTGNSTGPHLHFEVRTAQGKKVDPRKHLHGE